MKEPVARFEAPTMSEALEKVRSVFGEDGMIVGSRTFRRGGWLGVGGREVVEVFVADTRSRIANLRRETMNRGKENGDRAKESGVRWKESGVRSKESGVRSKESGVRSKENGAHRGKESGTRAKDSGVFVREAPSVEEIGAISDTLTQLRDDIQDLLAQSSEKPSFSHPFLKECYDLLILREVDPRVADFIVRDIAKLSLPPGFPTPARVVSVVRTQLSRIFVANPPVDPTVSPRVICLIGPTGVGKTTTIAKLAARAMINEGRRVGLITLDTFRIAAVDQLQKYAEIIGVPLRVVSQPEDLTKAIEDCRAEGIDLVFVDSAGRSHRDELKMVEITEFLSMVPNAEIHLVLSCTTHSRTIDNVSSRFASVSYDRIILTKTDETVSMGALVASLLKIAKPVSYITDGQNVPDDIMIGDPERLADLVLKSSSV
jgi:flagellar biosynthesis protein FlhF